MRCQANPPSLPGPTSRRVMGAHRGTDQTRGLPGDGDLLSRRVSTLPIPPRHPLAPRLKRPDPTVRRHPCPGSSGVEQWIENPRVGGSIPPPGTTPFSNPLIRHGFLGGSQGGEGHIRTLFIHQERNLLLRAEGPTRPSEVLVSDQDRVFSEDPVWFSRRRNGDESRTAA